MCNGGLVAYWNMDRTVAFGDEKAVIESVNNRRDVIHGHFKIVDGVSGKGIKFDGFTTRVICKASDAPHFKGAFTVEAWIAPQAYPWNWCAIINQEENHEKGYFFGIDELGHIGLHLSLDDEWIQCTTKKRVPFMTKWSHIAATFDEEEGITVYIDGMEEASLSCSGNLCFAENTDLQIGRNLTLLPPAALVRPHVSFPASYSFDGIIDEVKIYDRKLSAKEVMESYLRSKPKIMRPPLKWRKLPKLPHTGKFGAFYTKLKFYEEWDELWRVGDHPDVVVNFEEPFHMVFWRGTNFNMNLVTENGRWVGDQSAEGGGGEVIGCCEHMSDKQCRYAHVRIIENNDARVVVHWRYALCDVLYNISSKDPVTGWGNWADEYYTIYPDGVAVRHFIIHGRDPGYSITEPTVINQPGERAEDNIFLDAVTIANLEGDIRTYSWENWPGPGGVGEGFYNPVSNPTLCMLNLKSRYKPFYIYEPGTRIIPYGGGVLELRREYSHFPTWNHWPVSQIPSDGRYALAPDRVSSSAILSPMPPMRRNERGDLEGRFIMGLSNKKIEDLIPLNRFWLNPPELKILKGNFVKESFSRDEHAYIIRRENGENGALEFTLDASEDSPAVNPAFVIKGWGYGGAKMRINGETLKPSGNFRFGHRRSVNPRDLVVWIRGEFIEPVKISLIPVEMT